MKKIILLPLFLLLFYRFCLAQYSVLLNFNYINGAQPYGALTLVGSRLYGMTSLGGTPNYDGNIFTIDTNGGGYNDLRDFSGPDGQEPWGSLTYCNGRLFGMTRTGGTGAGNIFSIDTDGTGFKTLLNFNSTNGQNPYGSLALFGNKLFGMTSGGGAYTYGCIFSIDTNGNNYHDLFDFNLTNGGSSECNLIIYGKKLYGMTTFGGAHHCGVIFSIDTDGVSYKVLLNFDTLNGAYPANSLTIFGNKLYGMADLGGLHDSGCIFSLDTDGSGYFDLFDFNKETGIYPAFSNLILIGKTLYGTTGAFAGHGWGNIFSIDTNGGNFTDLFDFDTLSGEYPNCLIHDKDIFYGMTELGGTNSTGGVVFRFIDTTIMSSNNEIKSTKNTAKIYPIPFNKYTYLLFDNNEEQYIEIYDVMGRKVDELMTTKKINIINTEKLLSGVYCFKIYSKTKQFSTFIKALKE